LSSLIIAFLESRPGEKGAGVLSHYPASIRAHQVFVPCCEPASFVLHRRIRPLCQGSRRCKGQGRPPLPPGVVNGYLVFRLLPYVLREPVPGGRPTSPRKISNLRYGPLYTPNANVPDKGHPIIIKTAGYLFDRNRSIRILVRS